MSSIIYQFPKMCNRFVLSVQFLNEHRFQLRIPFWTQCTEIIARLLSRYSLNYIGLSERALLRNQLSYANEVLAVEIVRHVGSEVWALSEFDANRASLMTPCSRCHAAACQMSNLTRSQHIILQCLKINVVMPAALFRLIRRCY